MRTSILLFCLLALSFAGCRGDLAGRGTVRGQVTLDGAPLEQGSINFTPIDGKGVAAGGPIVAGRYELKGPSGPSIGTNRVEIRAVRKSGIMRQKPFAPEGEMVEADEEAIGEEFNTASKLQCEVKAGEQPHDFAVTSRPKSK